MSECKFRAADGECLRERAFPYKEFCVDGPCPHYTAKTNADRICSMSDEELAMFLQDIWYISGSNDTSNAWWLDWLKQETES